MPIVAMSIEVLLKHINAGAGERQLREEDLCETLSNIGCDVEEVAESLQFACEVCGKIFDRTEAQGPPLDCNQCGTNYRERGDALSALGPNRIIRFDMLANRPDIYDAGGMSRYVRGFLGIQTGLLEVPLCDAQITVAVDPRLSEETSLRPYISCAVLREVVFDHERIKMLMNMQENLHWALGRDRKLASIGVYDLDTLRGNPFHFDAVEPDAIRFVPLGFAPDAPESLLTPREILEKHGAGRKYVKLLQDFTAYPLLRDGEGTVLSMPPIINAEATRVTMESRNLFIDVTGLSLRCVDLTLNVLVTNLQELLPETRFEKVNIDAPQGLRVTPALAPSRMKLSVREASETIGVSFDAPQLSELLERMGHAVASVDGDLLTVHSPANRIDIMHPIDLIEDAAIAYGYEKLEPALVPTFTIGRPRLIEEQSALARRVMTGLGFHQVMTLVLTNEAAAFDKWRQTRDERAVVIQNPISSEQTICRVSLLPGMLETLSINKQYDLPQCLFEVGDCCFQTPQSETGASEERYVAGVMIGAHVGYADIRAVADAFVHELDGGYAVEAVEHASFLPGRVAGLRDRRGRTIGVMGEVHPEVLEAYGLRHPVSVFELSLEKLLAGEE